MASYLGIVHTRTRLNSGKSFSSFIASANFFHMRGQIYDRDKGRFSLVLSAFQRLYMKAKGQQDTGRVGHLRQELKTGFIRSCRIDKVSQENPTKIR